MTTRAGSAVAAHQLFQAEGGGSIPTSALSLRIEEIEMRLAKDLNERWHSMLPRTDLGNLLCGNTSAAYAAEFDGYYFAVAIFSQPIIRAIAKDGKTIELRRLAICADAPPQFGKPNAGHLPPHGEEEIPSDGKGCQLSRRGRSQGNDLQSERMEAGRRCLGGTPATKTRRSWQSNRAIANNITKTAMGD